jgi:hypothetical protein
MQEHLRIYLMCSVLSPCNKFIRYEIMPEFSIHFKRLSTINQMDTDRCQGDSKNLDIAFNEPIICIVITEDLK